MTHESQGMDLWVHERHQEIFSLGFRINRVLFSGRSAFQRVDVVETAGHGNMLMNDGLVMLTERDEFIYHDMIAHVPLFLHPAPKRVLIIGGGDGGTAREVLRHPQVEICRMVEIDEMVVQACRRHIPQTAACLDSDPRLQLTIADGVQFVAETDERFDVILIDSTDPIGPAEPLFGPEFYGNVKRVLNTPGIAVSQGESPFYNTPTQRSMLEILGQLFPETHIYNFTNMGYPGGLWSFTFASNGIHPLEDLDATRIEAAGLEFDYYSAAIHRAAFTLPAFMIRNLQDLFRSQR